MKLFISVIVIAVFITEIYAILDAGPYKLKLKQLSRCSKLGKNSVTGSWKVISVNRTRTMISANITLENDLNGWMRLHTHLKGKGSRTWNTVLDVFLEQCKVIEQFGKIYVTELFRKAGKNYSCIIEKGDYIIKDYIFDGDAIPGIPVFPYGDFRSEVSLYSNRSSLKVLETCVSFEGEVMKNNKNQHRQKING